MSNDKTLVDECDCPNGRAEHMPTCASLRATLATVKHGGCVQLPSSERTRFEAWITGRRLDTTRWSDGTYTDSSVALQWFAWQEAALSALSAQPSPGGQDASGLIQDLRAAVSLGRPLLHSDVDEIAAALAARQPVRQPMRSDLSGYAVAASQVRRGYDVECDRCGKFCDVGPGPCQPAQAVDLPYSLDADPAGIRARVADVITGTLMVSAQGHTPPPAGHWAEPFWKAARADATAQAVDLGPVRAALQAAEALCVCCASVDSYSRSELNAFGQNMRSQFTEALALIDSKAVGK